MSGIPHKMVDGSKETFVDTSCIVPLPTSQLLNGYGVQHDPHCLNNITRNSRDYADYWHKFTVCNESLSEYPKNFILKVITDFVYPCDLMPVHVTQKTTKIFFLARNCLQAILKLCKAGLVVPNPNKPESPFTVIIIKDVSKLSQIPHVNVEQNIFDVLWKRYKNNVLDLSRFHEDQDLMEFCSLAQTKLLLYVLNLSEKLEKIGLPKKIVKVILSHNDIKHLPNCESLRNRRFSSIDLSHNKIQNIENIVPLKDLPNLIALQLDGNPLCCRFDSGITYCLYVRNICKKLTTLDNRKLFEDGFYKKHRTFLCDTNGFNFANQFLEQYFTYYDELNRPNIESFYSENAMFSLTYRDIPNEDFVYRENRLAKEYKIRNRNIKDIVIKARHEYMLFRGKNNVVEQLILLPAVQHHPPSFYVDLMAYSKTQAIIHVTGVFRYISSRQSLNGFTRNFVLASDDGKEWMITNDQLFVYAPYKYRANLSSWPEPTSPSLFPNSNYNPSHMNALTMTFENITGMIYEHSKKFLEKNNWNLELALKVFIDEHINDEIPDEAFNDKSEPEQNETSDDDAVIITEDDILPPIETLLINNPKPSKQSVELSITETKQNKKRKTRTVKLPLQPTTGAGGSNQYCPEETPNFFQTENTSMFWDRMENSIPDPNSSSTSLTIDPTYSLLPHSSSFKNPNLAKLITTSSTVLAPTSTMKRTWDSFTLRQPSKMLLQKEKELTKHVVTPLSESTSLQIEKELTKHVVPPLSESTSLQIEKELTKRVVPPLSESTSLPIMSFHTRATETVKNLEGPEVHSFTPVSKLSAEEQDELSQQVMLQPRHCDWSLELRTRLAALRLPGKHAQRQRIRLKTLTGKNVRVTLPHSDDLPESSLLCMSAAVNKPSKMLQKEVTKHVVPPLSESTSLQIEKELTKHVVPPLSESTSLQIEKELAKRVVPPLSESTSLPIMSFHTRATETVKNLEGPEVHSFTPVSKLSAEEQDELAQQVMLQPRHCDWSLELRTRLAALRLPGKHAQRQRIQLKTLTGKNVRVTLPHSDDLPESSLLCMSAAVNKPSKMLQKEVTKHVVPPLSESTSLQIEKELTKHVVPPLSESTSLQIEKELTKRVVPPLSESTSLPIMSFHTRATETVKNLEGPEVHSFTPVSKLSAEEQDELAQQVMLQPRHCDWSLELRTRLAALRLPGKHAQRQRIRLKTLTGKNVRVTLPHSDDLPESSLLCMSAAVNKPSKMLQKEVTKHVVPPLSESTSLQIDKELTKHVVPPLSESTSLQIEKEFIKHIVPPLSESTSLPIISSHTRATETVKNLEGSEVHSFTPVSKLSAEEQDELAQQIRLQPRDCDWSLELRTRLAALRLPGRHAQRQRIRLKTLKGKSVRVTLPHSDALPESWLRCMSAVVNKPSNMLLQKEKELTKHVVPPLSESTSLPIISSHTRATETVKNLEGSKVHSFTPVSKLSAEEQDELAQQIRLQPRDCDWSLELRTRLAALRLPGRHAQRQRIRLKTLKGKSVRVTLPHSDDLPESWLRCMSAVVNKPSNMLFQKEKELTKHVVPPLSESTSLPIISSHTRPTETIEKLKGPEVHSFTPVSKLSAEEQDELAQQIRRQPRDCDWSLELRTRLAALRLPGRHAQRQRIRLKTLKGKSVRVTLPHSDDLPESWLLCMSAVVNKPTNMLLQKEKELTKHVVPSLSESTSLQIEKELTKHKVPPLSESTSF